MDDVTSDFDLNSLIEGVVDDDDDSEDGLGTRSDPDDAKTPVVLYREPLKVKFYHFYAPF